MKGYSDRLLKGEDSRITRQFLQLPLYLQELIGESSHHFTKCPDEYNVLVNSCIDQTDKVLFLTLNYDSFLENALGKPNDFFTESDNYINNSKWSLVKIHGSINWYRKIKTSKSIQDSRDNLLRLLNEEPLPLVLDENFIMFPLTGHQRYSKDSYPMYPAITVPIDGKYEYNCPAKMIRHAEEFLKICRNFLFIGTTGNDGDLIDLLKNINQGQALLVGRNEEKLNKTKDKIISEVPALQNTFNIFCRKNGFTDFIYTADGLDNFLNSLL